MVYQTTPVSHRSLAKLEQVSYSTLSQRAMREGWRKLDTANKKIVAATGKALESEIDRRAAALVHDQLAPFIEKHKAAITKRAVKLSNRGLARLEKLWRDQPPDAAKSESEGAKTLETFVRVARVSLGMGDGSPVAPALTLNLLTTHSAVQIAPARRDETEA
jgi:hypothetical protein